MLALQNTTGAAGSGYVRLYSLPARIAAAVLVVISRASLPLLLLLVLLANDPPITPPILLPLFAVLVAVPAFGAWSIERLHDARWEASASNLVVTRRRLRLEIPFGAIADAEPWSLALPGPGFTLITASGRRFRFESSDPTDLLNASTGSRCGEHPMVIYAREKHAVTRRLWYHPVGKFVVFALLPTALLFNVHQHIAYGGTLGEYYLLGLRSYLTTFAVYWSTVAIYLLLYASVWRGLAEGVALVTAWIRPARARSIRIAVERACSLLYYGGVPVIVAARFWP